LGARDSLRLEMGYPLYGHDLDDTTSPIEAAIGWVVSKSNDNFIGSSRVLKEKIDGVKRKRMGVKLLDRGIAREGTEIKKDGKKIGVLSSGGFSPNLKVSIGQGYFDPSVAKIGDQVFAVVRDREIPAVLASPVFVEAKTKSIKK
jgi:aminomethyltransferase